jgi:hypothetical protein
LELFRGGHATRSRLEKPSGTGRQVVTVEALELEPGV